MSTVLLIRLVVLLPYILDRRVRSPAKAVLGPPGPQSLHPAFRTGDGEGDTLPEPTAISSTTSPPCPKTVGYQGPAVHSLRNHPQLLLESILRRVLESQSRLARGSVKSGWSRKLRSVGSVLRNPQHPQGSDSPAMSPSLASANPSSLWSQIKTRGFFVIPAS